MNKPLILVVEDDTAIRSLITTTLKAHDYRYLTAVNGESAVLEASSHNPDIILLDLGLPDIDGVEVIRRVRSWSNLPIIVISARSEDTDKIDALDAGADDYLTKPFSVEELLARLRVTQRRLDAQQSGTVNAEAVFTNGKLKVDYACGAVGLDVCRYESMMVVRADLAMFTLRCPHCKATVSSMQPIPPQLYEEVRFAALEVGAGMGLE